ncbi:glycosyltransferase [Alteribacillus sp. YIM 98480]|uniref:MGDG synthase family glycosyltransferase n=1 Tax=Alteribacillus sp. YIM 98480 TaxID=2606599 RepID=UPI00131AF3A6|nr:glycosyltransferase [Alteribacillus sp. YIM 98480]
MHIHILTASFGNGHNQAAFLLKKTAIAHKDTVSVYHPLETTAPSLYKMSKKVYGGLLFSFPEAWRKLVLAKNPSSLSAVITTLSRLYQKSIEKALQADLVLSVHPLLTALAAEVKKRKQLSIPLYSVATDYWTSPLASHPFVNGVFVSEIEDTKWAREDQDVFPAGIPVEIGEKHVTKKECCLKNGWDPKKPLLLVSGGGEGIFPYRKVGEELKKLKIPSTIVMLSGTSRWKFDTTSYQHDIHMLPFTDCFTEYLHAADLLISKAGGMTMTEAVLCEVPILVYSPLPGHEEHNARCLTNRQAAFWAKTPLEIKQKTEELLLHPLEIERAKRRLRHIKKKNSAEIIISIAKFHALQAVLPSQVHGKYRDSHE